MVIEFLLGFFISLFAGIIGSMVGIGGGIVITPFLSYFNYLPSQISSTSLMAVFSTSLSSSFFYYRKKLLSKKIGLILSVSSIPGTYFGVIISKLFSLSEFRFYFAFILIATSLYLILKSKLKNKNHFNSTNYHQVIVNKNDISLIKLLFIVISSFFAGILSSSFGIGGGIIFVPSLIILLGFDMNQAAATSQFALLFTSLSGLLIYIYYGFPDYFIGIVLSIGSLIGGSIGAKISPIVPSNILLKIFSAVLIIVSIKLLFDGFTLF
jgi:uncharacterized protein